MIVFFALLSLVGLAVAFVIPGWSDLVLLAGPCLLASLWLLWRRGPPRRPPDRQARQHVILDGSNIMHWAEGAVSLDPVVQAVRQLEARGLTVGVIFDANAGYKTHDRYQDDAAMARRLGLPEERVLVVPKGTVADRFILQAARRLGAKVITNDRYRDWLTEFPEAANPGFLIRGGVRQGVLWLDGP